MIIDLNRLHKFLLQSELLLYQILPMFEVKNVHVELALFVPGLTLLIKHRNTFHVIKNASIKSYIHMKYWCTCLYIQYFAEV